MKLTKILCVVSVAAIAAIGCKKDEKKGDEGKTPSAGKTTTGDTTPPDKPEPPKTKEWTGADSLAAYNKCSEVFNARDAKRLGECYGDDASFSMIDWLGPKMDHRGLAAINKSMTDYWAAFPDVTGKAQLTLVNGANVASIGLEEGTNSGKMGPMPATNKKVSSFSAGIVTYAPTGKIASQRLLMDQTTWSHQMGMIKNPTSPSSEKAWEKSVTAVASKADQAKIDANVAIVKNLEKASAEKNLDTIKAHLADDVSFRYVPMAEAITGAEKYLEGMKMWGTGWDSMTRDVKSAWGAGDWVVVEVASKGKLGDIPNPKKVKTKGKEVSTHQIAFYKVVDNKVAAHWVFENSYAFAVQAGLADAPPAMPDMPAKDAAKDGAKPKKQ